MENKSVCYYCGTIYETAQGKCPLCGSTLQSKEETAARPEPRRRLTEQERKDRQKSSKGKFSAQKSSPKKKKDSSGTPMGKVLLICAMIFLIFAIGVVLFFIGDMIGWWPGIEDRIERRQASIALERSCQVLEVEPEGFEFDALGETAALVVSVNVNCEEVVYCKTGDESIVTISQEAVTEEGEELKSATFTVTSVGAGETEITVSCGDKIVTRSVKCTNPDDYAPVPDCGSEIVFTALGESKTVTLLGLPESKTASWSSDNENVASVDNGVITANGKGEATVTVEVNGKPVQIMVRCDFEMPLDKTAKTKYNDVTLKIGEKFKFYLFGNNGKGDRITEDVTYQVNNSSLLTIEDGVITAVKKGTTTVTIVYGDPNSGESMTFECIVRIRG